MEMDRRLGRLISYLTEGGFDEEASFLKKIAQERSQATYTVRSGDSLYSIARKYPGVSAENIMAHNGLTSSDISPGQEISIPHPGPPQASGGGQANSSPPQNGATVRGDEITHIVANNENLFIIARKYPGVSAENIMVRNNLDSDMIQPGQSLIIPRGEHADFSGRFVGEDRGSFDFSEEEIIAATLLGEGGSLDSGGEAIMKRVLKVIKNRASYTGLSEYQIAYSEDFSHWLYYSGADGITVFSNVSTESGKRKWQRALQIVRSGEVDNSVGESTYYYNPSITPNPDYITKSDGTTPNPCWREIYRDARHVYGVAGYPWDNCNPDS